MDKKKALFYHIGGKNGELGEEISCLLPSETPDVYIEPFGGSFAIGIKSDYDPSKVLLIHNDMDNIVHSIFKSVTQYPEETLDAVYDLLEKYDYEQSTVDYIRFIFNYKNLTGIDLFSDEIYLGAAAWILKYMTRNGDCEYIKTNIDDMDKLYKIFEKREDIAFDLEGAVALSMDAMDILSQIKQHGRSHDLKIFLYIDAPYTHSGKRTTKQDLYRVDIDKEDKDIENLANLLVEINQCTDCKIMVSEYDNPIYNQILSEKNGFRKIAVLDVPKSMYYSKNGECKPIETEYVWCNY